MSSLFPVSIDCHIHLQIEKTDELLQAMEYTNTQKVILLGSSKFTFTLNPDDGFTKYHDNNIDLLSVKSQHPDKFEVWPTLDPLFNDNTSLLHEYIDKGATGLKLYVGHGYSYGDPPKYMFHTTAIDGNELMDVYELCSANEIPICLHVNTTDNAPGFRDEFESVLLTFPKLKILCPHWMLATRRPSYVRKMLDRYDNLWTDTSFGHDSFFDAGMKRISENRITMTKIIMDFPNRILCGSDIVCTKAPHKTMVWMANRMLAYKFMLSEQNYLCPITGLQRNGLSLPKDILFKVFQGNAINLLAKQDAPS